MGGIDESLSRSADDIGKNRGGRLISVLVRRLVVQNLLAESKGLAMGV